MLSLTLPVSIDEASVDIVAALHAAQWLQADPRGLEGQDVDQAVLQLVRRQAR